MGNLVNQVFNVDGNFQCPAGVTSITVTTKRAFRRTLVSLARDFNGFCSQGFIDAFYNAYLFGGNGSGQLGDTTTTDRNYPLVAGASIRFRKIAGNEQSMIGLDFFGNLYTWGLNSNGQLGLGDTTLRSSPTLINIVAKFIDIIASPNGVDVLALAVDGNVWGAGLNASGELGNGTTAQQVSLVEVTGGNFFRKIAMGGMMGSPVQSSYGISTSGSAYAWGKNTNGRLGDNTTTDRSAPTLVSGGHVFTEIVAGADFALALDTAGAAWAWGNNTNGQLGDGTNTERHLPTAVIGGHVFTKIYAHANCAFAIDAAGNAYSWGLNDQGQLGQGDTTARNTPTLIPGGILWERISPAKYGTGQNCSVIYGIAQLGTSTGLAYAWGRNSRGQLGDSTTADKHSPVAILGSFSGIKEVVGSGLSAIAVNQFGYVFTWGANTQGQLGTADNTDHPSANLVDANTVSDIRENYQTTRIDVTPGVVYSVSLSSFFARFNNVVVGEGPCDNVVVSYQH